jgi:hypothetical protein
VFPKVNTITFCPTLKIYQEIPSCFSLKL